MSKSPIVKYYDRYWAPGGDWSPTPTLSPLKRNLLARFVAPNTCVLDVGCGDGGHYGRLLAAMASEYHGLDVSEIAVEAAKRSGILAQQHDLQSPFPYTDDSFDLVLCIEVLEHVFEPARALLEMGRVLRPGGHILLSVPNVAHISNRIRMLLGGFSPGGTPETSAKRPWADPHIRFFTARSLATFVAAQDLLLQEMHGEGFSLFSTLPVFSSIAARLVGWQRLEHLSHPFEFMARWWPSLCAGHLLAVVTCRCP